MKGYKDIAQDTDTAVEDVRAAMNMAERLDMDFYRERWFVNSDNGAAFGQAEQRYQRAFATGRTKVEAVENALAAGYRAARSNWNNI